MGPGGPARPPLGRGVPLSGVATQARELVASWPEGGRALGVVVDPADPAWSGRALLKLIRAAGDRHRPAFLLDLAPEASNLTARFGAAGSDGFAEVVAGEGATLASIAHRRPEIDGAYLPRGVGSPGGRLAGSGALSTLADRVREAGGALLVVLDRDGARAAAEAGWPDGWVLVGDPEAAAGGEDLPGGLPQMGRIEYDGPTADGAGEGRWRRHRESGSFPTVKVAAGVALLAALAGGWWWYAGRVTGPGASETGPPPATAPDTAVPAADDSAAGGGSDAGGSGADGAIEPDEPGGSGDARELGYSVLMASYASAGAARERVRQLSSRVGGLFFVAPTPVRGSVWHRVYAGSVAGRDSAVALMERLVEAGAKEEVRGWDVRPVRWSFRLTRSFADSAAASARADELRERGLPAYVLPAGGGGYRVYSGAYEARSEAATLGSRLEEAGVEAELVRRSGGSP